MAEPPLLAGGFHEIVNDVEVIKLAIKAIGGSGILCCVRIKNPKKASFNQQRWLRILWNYNLCRDLILS